MEPTTEYLKLIISYNKNDNDKDEQEKIFNQYKEQYPNEQMNILYLIYILCNHHDLSKISSKLLFDLISYDSEECLWLKLTHNTRLDIISFLLTHLKIENDINVIECMSDVLSFIYKSCVTNINQREYVDMILNGLKGILPCDGNQKTLSKRNTYHTLSKIATLNNLQSQVNNDGILVEILTNAFKEENDEDELVKIQLFHLLHRALGDPYQNTERKKVYHLLIPDAIDFIIKIVDHATITQPSCNNIDNRGTIIYLLLNQICQIFENYQDYPGSGDTIFKIREKLLSFLDHYNKNRIFGEQNIERPIIWFLCKGYDIKNNKSIWQDHSILKKLVHSIFNYVSNDKYLDDYMNWNNDQQQQQQHIDRFMSLDLIHNIGQRFQKSNLISMMIDYIPPFLLEESPTTISMWKRNFTTIKIIKALGEDLTKILIERNYFKTIILKVSKDENPIVVFELILYLSEIKFENFNDEDNGLKQAIQQSLYQILNNHHQPKILIELCALVETSLHQHFVYFNTLIFDILSKSLKPFEKNLFYKASKLTSKLTRAFTQLNGLSYEYPKLSYSLLETMRIYQNDSEVVNLSLTNLDDIGRNIEKKTFTKIVGKVMEMATKNPQSQLIIVADNWLSRWSSLKYIEINNFSIYLPFIIKNVRESFLNDKVDPDKFELMCKRFKEKMYPYVNSLIPLAIKINSTSTMKWGVDKLLTGILVVCINYNNSNNNIVYNNHRYKESIDIFQLFSKSLIALLPNGDDWSRGHIPFGSISFSNISKTLTSLIDLMKLTMIGINQLSPIIDWLINIVTKIQTSYDPDTYKHSLTYFCGNLNKLVKFMLVSVSGDIENQSNMKHLIDLLVQWINHNPNRGYLQHMVSIVSSYHEVTKNVQLFPTIIPWYIGLLASSEMSIKREASNGLWIAAEYGPLEFLPFYKKSLEQLAIVIMESKGDFVDQTKEELIISYCKIILSLDKLEHQENDEQIDEEINQYKSKWLDFLESLNQRAIDQSFSLIYFIRENILSIGLLMDDKNFKRYGKFLDLIKNK